MHIGITRPPAPPHPIPDIDGAVIARVAEEVGFEAVFYGEHPVRPVDAPGENVHPEGVPFFQDTMVMLARASAVTERITLGSAIFLLPVHQPVLFAKQLASLDFYSGGRLVIGGGVGWSRAECEVMGGNFDRRWGQAREAVELMKALWSQDTAEYHGEFFDMPPMQLFPKPASKPWPPVLLPGPRYDAKEPMDSPALRKFFKRIVTFGDGWLPGIVGTESINSGPARVAEGRRVIESICDEMGRDPGEMQVNVQLRCDIPDGDLTWPELVSRDTLKRYEDIGVERALVTLPTVTSESHAREVVTRVAEAVL